MNDKNNTPINKKIELEIYFIKNVFFKRENNLKLFQKNQKKL